MRQFDEMFDLRREQIEKEERQRRSQQIKNLIQTNEEKNQLQNQTQKPTTSAR